MPVVRLPAPKLVALLQEIRFVCEELERFTKVNSDFAVGTAEEIDELFAKVDHI
jgi:hypothetical protein